MSESTATAPFDPPGLDWRPAQKGLLALRLIGNGVASAVIAAAGIGVWVLFPETWILVVTGVLFLPVASQFAFIPRRVRAIAWAVRDRDLFFRQGVMFRKLVVVPYTRVQFVDITAGPVERAFGLVGIKVNTAAADEDISIPGLSPEDGAMLREILTDKSKLDPVR